MGIDDKYGDGKVLICQECGVNEVPVALVEERTCTDCLLSDEYGYSPLCFDDGSSPLDMRGYPIETENPDQLGDI